MNRLLCYFKKKSNHRHQRDIKHNLYVKELQKHYMDVLFTNTYYLNILIEINKISNLKFKQMFIKYGINEPFSTNIEILYIIIKYILLYNFTKYKYNYNNYNTINYKILQKRIIYSNLDLNDYKNLLKLELKHIEKNNLKYDFVINIIYYIDHSDYIYIMMHLLYV